jgi:hypothetical protein
VTDDLNLLKKPNFLAVVGEEVDDVEDTDDRVVCGIGLVLMVGAPELRRLFSLFALTFDIGEGNQENVLEIELRLSR